MGMLTVYMYASYREILVLFRSYLFVRTPFAQALCMEVDRGRPSGHSSHRDWGYIRAVCRAWRTFQSFFFGGSGLRRFPGFSFVEMFCAGAGHPSFLEISVGCFCSYVRTYNTSFVDVGSRSGRRYASASLRLLLFFPHVLFCVCYVRIIVCLQKWLIS